MINNRENLDRKSDAEKEIENGGDEVRVYYQVVENLFQKVLPIWGDEMAKYDTRIIKKRITSRVKAETLAEKLQAQTDERRLSHQFRYEVEAFYVTRAKRL